MNAPTPEQRSCLTVSEKSCIHGMKQAGLSPAQIARETGKSPSTIYSVLQRIKQSGSVELAPRSGRPPKLSERDKRSLGRTLVNCRRDKLAEITNSMATKVSNRTVRKAANELGFSARVAAKKPFLTKKHKANRLAFAKQHKN